MKLQKFHFDVLSSFSTNFSVFWLISGFGSITNLQILTLDMSWCIVFLYVAFRLKQKTKMIDLTDFSVRAQIATALTVIAISLAWFVFLGNRI